MIDRVCNVVREARVSKIGIRVKQVDQVGPWRVVHKPGVHEAYHCVWVVLGKQGWRVLRPVLDKVAGDKLDGAPFLNQDVPTLVCLVSLEHTTWDSPRRLRKRDCRTFNGCCIVDELQILKSKYGPTFKPENTTRWELVICDEVRVHCFLVYCWELIGDPHIRLVGVDASIVRNFVPYEVAIDEFCILRVRIRAILIDLAVEWERCVNSVLDELEVHETFLRY